MTINADLITEIIINALKEGPEIPLGISNRHIHLSAADLATCFGADCLLTPMKDLSQPGQYAAKETVTICGPKGAIEKVRVLGPVRKQTQVEILAGDCFKLGIQPYLRLSGDVEGSAPITIIGPKGSVFLKEGAIVAQRHIHMTPEDAQRYQVHDQQVVSIQWDGDRGGTYRQVVIRVTRESALDCHLDVEEANAMGLKSSSTVKIIK